MALIDFTQEQVALIKSQIAPKATDDELKLFLYQCRRTGLDPLARQIYCIHLKGKMTIQTSIDGFRVIAERSGVYAGQSEPKFENDANGMPFKCTMSVYKFRENVRYEASIAVAFFKEYCQMNNEYVNGQATGRKVPGEMWAKMPHTMLAKVTEALALRKAFPNDLSGLYTTDEMMQASQSGERSAETPQPDPLQGRGSQGAGHGNVQQQQLPSPTGAPFNPQYSQMPQAAQSGGNASQNGERSAVSGGNMPQQQQQPITPYNQTYADINAVMAVIAAAKDEKDLETLYRCNNILCNKPAVIAALKKQKLWIKNGFKAIITDQQFASIMERIDKEGEVAYNNALNTCVLNDTQVNKLKQRLQQRNELEKTLTIKFVNEADIAQVIAMCYNAQQLMKLHQNNSLIIDRTPELMTRLNARLAALKNAA